MDIKTVLQNSLKDAIRSKDDVRKRTLRMALTSIKLAEVDKGESLDESATLAILQKEVRKCQETAAEARNAGRPELATDAEAEIAVLEEFLPESMTDEELEALTQEVINEVGATSMQDMGKVMKVLIPRLEGRASGQEANQMVRKLLA
jgi:uncharacterized protein YqeY